MNAGKNEAMEKFLIKALIVDVVILTLEDGMTNTRLGATRTDVSHVTTRSPSKNFPGVAPPAPQIQMICERKLTSVPHRAVLLTSMANMAFFKNK